MDIDSRRDQLIEMIDLLPEATSEDPGEGIQHIGFSVRKKRFAWYLDDHHGDGVVAVTCKAAAGVNTELPPANPDRFFKPSYSGSRGWIGIRLDVETVDWDEVGRFLEDAYRLTAPKSLIAILDES